MKITPHLRRKPKGYIILMMVLCFACASLIILAGTLNRQASTAVFNEHNNQYMVTIEAAEAATESVLARIIIDNRNGGDGQVSANLGQYQTNIPLSSDNPYWANFAFYDGNGRPNRTSVIQTSSSTFVPLGFQYQGLSGKAATFRIISDVVMTDGRFKTMTNCVQQDIQTAQIPLFQFAIFYNSLLNFVDTATMTVTGPVHANGSIYTAPGSSATLTFSNDVSATGMIQLLPTDSSGSYQSYGGFSSSDLNMSGVANYGLLETNTSTLALPIGTNNASSNVLQVLYPAQVGDSSALYSNRYYNKAEMIILISNSSVSASIQQPYGGTPTTIPWNNNLSFFVNTNVSFTDQRENSTMKLTQIDIGNYTKWAYTNASVKTAIGSAVNGSGMAPNVLYIGDFRTSAILTNEFAVRITNGTVLPTNNTGLTIATPNPLYILGNYNVTNSAYLGTTNTSASVPASFLADAITVLSSNWSSLNYDTNSTKSYTARNAGSTTINAAIVAGVVYSTGANGATSWDGGVENFPRLLEDWSNDTLTLNTSIVNLFSSVIATNIFIKPGTYYEPPTRKWAFDSYHFSNPATQPPGTPYLYPTIRLDWDNPPPNTTNYTGW